MKTKKAVLASVVALLLPALAPAEPMVVDGVRYECADGVCRIAGDAGVATTNATAAAGGRRPSRIAHGYMPADEFLAFLRGDADAAPALPRSALLLALALLVAGAALNLTPCALPMIPVTLMVVGKSPRRGVLYGLGMASAYGALGALAASGGLAFGAVQSSPVFNIAVALAFLAFGAALVAKGFRIDFSAGRTSALVAGLRRLGPLFPFFMGAVSATLAGACVAPVLVSALVLTADLSAKGLSLAWAIPFLLGIGMALPWPFLAAGMRVLPRPGAWMRWVNAAFAALLFVFAARYLLLAAGGGAGASGGGGRDNMLEADVASFDAVDVDWSRPVLVDCWATWCRNCAAMEGDTLRDPRVVEALRRFQVVRLQAEDIEALRRIPGFESVRGLPAFVLFD